MLHPGVVCVFIYSYEFLGFGTSLHAADTYPSVILDGDDNLAVNGVRVKPGILKLPTTNFSLTWTKGRHHGFGNIGMADGSVSSVQQITSAFLNLAVIPGTNGAPVATDGWVIP
jgi:prepilin-type processing-associated H-X9-DG protein